MLCALSKRLNILLPDAQTQYNKRHCTPPVTTHARLYPPPAHFVRAQCTPAFMLYAHLHPDIIIYMPPTNNTNITDATPFPLPLDVCCVQCPGAGPQHRLLCRRRCTAPHQPPSSATATLPSHPHPVSRSGAPRPQPYPRQPQQGLQVRGSCPNTCRGMTRPAPRPSAPRPCCSRPPRSEPPARLRIGGRAG